MSNIDSAPTSSTSAPGGIVVRNVGGRITPEVINDVAFIAQIAENFIPHGPRFEVAVIHHTQCGSAALIDDTFRHRYADRIGANESALRGQAVLEPDATVMSDIEQLLSAEALGHASNCPATSTTSRPAWWRPSSTPNPSKE